MPENKILPFATHEQATVLTDSEYASDSERPLGNQMGIARPDFVNKSLRQSSVMASALAQFAVDNAGQDINDSMPVNDIANALVEATKQVALTSALKPRVNIIKFENSGTYTPTSGTQFIIVEAVGGGGAGGGASVTAANSVSVGAGGGGGGYCKSKIDISEISGSVTVTIGAGGVGSVGVAGGAGGATSFGTFFTANGGSGGAKAGPANSNFGAAGGYGGLTTGANILGLNGSRGGNAFTTYPSYTFGGNGGNSGLGMGGAYSTAGNGWNGSGYGAGGGGVEVSGGTTGTYRGGNGAAGVVIITEYILE